VRGGEGQAGGGGPGWRSAATSDAGGLAPRGCAVHGRARSRAIHAWELPCEPPGCHGAACSRARPPARPPSAPGHDGRAPPVRSPLCRRQRRARPSPGQRRPAGRLWVGSAGTSRLSRAWRAAELLHCCARPCAHSQAQPVQGTPADGQPRLVVGLQASLAMLLAEYGGHMGLDLQPGESMPLSGGALRRAHRSACFAHSCRLAWPRTLAVLAAWPRDPRIDGRARLAATPGPRLHGAPHDASPG